MNKRKVYPPEFKREAVVMAQLPNVVVEEVARNLGISSGSLHPDSTLTEMPNVPNVY